MAVTTDKVFLQGGEFLIKDAAYTDVFSPEDFNEEQLMIQETCVNFLNNEIKPSIKELENKNYGLAQELLVKMGQLGLVGAHIPEVYGGMELDTNTNTLISEAVGPAGSFCTTFAAHIGIGMLPILYFGTEEQKKKYLPGMSTGELVGAYCLTEPSSGSDALSAKTKAELSEDGEHYIINGQKMWISNAGFADVFVVFAQVDGDKFTGFIVDKGTEGLSLGAEEHKLGIHGSSTRQVFFENMKVPKSAVLGEIGKGHLIAFNALNIGRFKLCVLSTGGSKDVVTMATKYANERIQFKVPISSFGAIQHKLAEMTTRTFACDSAMYRVSDLLQQKKAEFIASGLSFGDAQLKASEEYAIECAILKVVGSDALDYTVDEGLQVHGGMGFSEEGDIARAYRDSRIAKIYEGTNEINRLLTVDMLLKRAMKGKLDIVGPAWDVQKELTSMPSMTKPEGKYGQEIKAVKDFKKAILMVAGAAAKLQMEKKINLKHEQEILMNVADMMNDLYLAESMLLRVQKLNDKGTPKHSIEVYDAMLKLFITDATARFHKNATDALVSFAQDDLLKTLLLGLKRFTKYTPTNVKEARRAIAKVVIEENKYPF